LLSGFHVSVADLGAELSLLFGCEEGDLINFLEICLQAAFGRNGGLLSRGRFWGVGRLPQ